MCTLFTAFLLCSFAAAAQTPTPTWSADIACIVYTHCAPCHREGGAGHLPLTSFMEAYPYRNDIHDATQLRLMPPWPPDEEYRSLAHERLLTTEEVDLIATWVNGGAPEGDPNLAPPPPTFVSDWVNAQPDIPARMEEYVVPPSTNDNYVCFVLPINNPSVVFAWIVYPSREARDRINAAVMADPRMLPMQSADAALPFDCKRMAYGGFRVLVEC